MLLFSFKKNVKSIVIIALVTESEIFQCSNFLSCPVILWFFSYAFIHHFEKIFSSVLLTMNLLVKTNKILEGMLQTCSNKSFLLMIEEPYTRQYPT